MNDDISPLDAIELPNKLPDGITTFPNGKPKFATGNKFGGRKKQGDIGKKGTLVHALGITDWKALKGYVETKGINRFMQELEELNGKDYIVAFLGILPYIKGKVASVEYVHEGQTKSSPQTHTVTIKDMRDNSIQVLNGNR